MNNTESRCAHALAWAKKGFRVFPLGKGSKIPLLTSWGDKATTDEATIRSWWSGTFKTETKAGNILTIPAAANVGICPGNDFIIIDVDTAAHGADGAAELRKLVDEGLPQTLTIRTPSGGLHLYYTHPKGTDVQGSDTSYVKSVTDWRGSEARQSGIDIRGNRGQGVAAGSVVADGEYVIAVAKNPVALPTHIAAQLPFKRAVAPSMDALPSHLSGKTSTDNSLEVSGTSELSDLPDRVELGTRDTVIFKYACSWRERGYSLQVASILMKELIGRCEQGSDPISVEDGIEKLERAYSEYSPSKQSEWVDIAMPTGATVGARAVDVKSLQSALDRFVYVEDGDRVADLARHPSHAVLKRGEFEVSFGNIKLEVGEDAKGNLKKAPLPKVWATAANRLTCRGVGYQPMSPDKAKEGLYTYQGETFFNTWIGSGLTIPEVADPEHVRVFTEHLKFIFGNDTAEMNHFIDWLCFTVRFPQIRITHAALIIGATRTGKGWISGLMSKLLGEQNVSVVHNADVLSDHNTWISNSTLSVIDDIIPTEGTHLWAKVKSDITENRVEVNHKYGKKGQERVFANVLAFSNYDDAIALDHTDQRLWMYKSTAIRQSDDYYSGIFKWLESDGPAHIMKFMLDRDLSKFAPGALPRATSAKAAMIDATQSTIEASISDGIADGLGCFGSDVISYAQAYNYVRADNDIDRLDEKQKKEIQRAIAVRSTAAPSNPYKVNGKSVRLRCIRNTTTWDTAPTKDLLDEYARGLTRAALRIVETPPVAASP